MRTSTLLLLASGAAALFGSTSSAIAACDPQVVASPTHFPIQSRARGQQGTVELEVTVDESGRVSSTEIVRSSGSGFLDRAAARSARKLWQFDVTNCERKDLPATDRINVEYRYEQQ
jgi:TonB family protein